MNTPAPVVRLKNAWNSSHPWIFQRLVEKPASRPKPGADRRRRRRRRRLDRPRLLQRPFAHRAAHARDRSGRRRSTPAGSRARSPQAVSLRREVLKLDEISDAWRVVHSEGDGICPAWSWTATATCSWSSSSAAGAFRHREWIYDALREAVPGLPFPQLRRRARAEAGNLRLPRHRPPAEPAVITEYGVKFRADPAGAHKTGFFADQRENRQWLSQQVRRQARARPVLQHRRLRGVRRRARRGRGGRHRHRRRRDRDRQGQRQAQQRAPEVRPGRHLPVAARCRQRAASSSTW